MKNKRFFSASFTTASRAMMRKQGKAGNRFAPSSCAARGLDPRGSHPGAAGGQPCESLNGFVPLASLGVVAMTVQRDRKTR
jgi:hypothetical protein